MTEIDDGNPPRLREVASFGFWAAVVVVLAFGVPTGTKGVVVGVENGWFFVRFDGVQMTVSVIRKEIEKVEE